jgi:hypothetical protein
MRSLEFNRILAGPATAVTIAACGSAFAHGGGIGGLHLDNTIGNTSTNLTGNNGGKLTHLGDRDGRRRFRFIYDAVGMLL